MSETPLKQLTDSNSNNFYPVTSSSGVYRPDSSTVEAALAAIPTATSDLENDSNFISEGQANSITGSMIQDNAVTAGNIDFATFPIMHASLPGDATAAAETLVKFSIFSQIGGFKQYQLGSVFYIPESGVYEINCALAVGKWGGNASTYFQICTCDVVGTISSVIYTGYESTGGNYSKATCPSFPASLTKGMYICVLNKNAGEYNLGGVGPSFLSIKYLRDTI